MPISLRVRATRMAISPRLAMRTFWNTAAQSIYLGRRGLDRLGAPPLRQVVALIRATTLSIRRLGGAPIRSFERIRCAPDADRATESFHGFGWAATAVRGG